MNVPWILEKIMCGCECRVDAAKGSSAAIEVFRA